MKIYCADKTLTEVFKSGYYKIPRFQRPYSWTRENVEEFWNDAVSERETTDYFIGSVVVYKTEGEIYGIVDGQQRFATITMILCALRNFLKREGFQDLAKGVHNLIERKDINNKNQYILQTETSYPYLQENIQKFTKSEIKTNIGTKEEEITLGDAFKYINTNLDNIIAKVKNDTKISQKNKKKIISDKLKEIRDHILGLKLIFVELEGEDDAYLIFETLNTRGKDLRLSDLVKSYITRLLKPKNINVDLYKETWHKMVELIEQSSFELSFDSFLHHFWLSKHDYVTAKKLYKKLKGVVTSKKDARNFLNDLNENAVIYREIHETPFRKWKKEEQNIKRSLEALNLFKVKQDLPMIISIMRAYKSKRLKLKSVEDILNVIENFHFIFTAITSQRSSGGISFMYALSARELDGANNYARRLEVLRELKKKLKAKIPPYQEFESNFINIRYSRKITKQKKLVQYILSKIDRYSQKSGIATDYEGMTIEHLASENAGASNSISSEKLAQIGNLILVNELLNNKLGNKNFTQKKKLLAGSSIWIDQIIEKSNDWGAKEIEKRSRFLSKIAYNNVWEY